jgi:hypothetical protein
LEDDVTTDAPPARSPLRIAIVALGAFFTLQALGWIFTPARAAARLGMPLLDGVGRSTQAGDFGAFFLVAGVLMLVGTRPGRAHLLYFPALLIGTAAILRTWAWLVHGAAFAGLFITVELITAGLLMRAAGQFDSPS